ncbi:Colicin I receptor precursor [Enhygromyxa salina]|uniref:Colicin I receptor n=1 Tax=Enhygromyxa salina TaxID=215803 RepID=A0A2S9XDB0_9BACT|nr:TonB-dependent receptor [Enhygromyxa salina]PRP90842.1 Colicin I receptor precursor [Enhygromyxa salina]
MGPWPAERLAAALAGIVVGLSALAPSAAIASPPATAPEGSGDDPEPGDDGGEQTGDDGGEQTGDDGEQTDDDGGEQTDDTAREIIVPSDTPDNYVRDASVVSRRQIQERLPRSAPDALRFEPGVFVQQSAHAQASPYVRGLTGQQTLIAFDGIRLNTSTFRQGPNQYFFTVDSRTIQRLEVVRGSASTRWGSDAIGGALLTTPLDPTLDPSKGWTVHPRVMLTHRTADSELGGRAQLDLGWKGKVGVVAGVGYREVGQLVTAGAVTAPATGLPWKEPRLASDERTQIGTGFRELTADARVVWQINDRWRLTGAYYDYRQKDAPRTDKCPPAEAPDDECLVYLDQFRTLTYLAADMSDGPAVASRVRISASYQNQHERTQLTRDNGIAEIDGGTESNGKDDVHTLGLRAALSSAALPLGERLSFGVDYGGEVYFDLIESNAWLVFTDISPPVTSISSRGQYIDGSRYLTSGMWAEPHMWIGERVRVRAGGRAAFVWAKADGDEQSETAAVDRKWATAVGNAGLMVLAADWLSWHLDFDQGFRAPNLDDLTSRQQTGPGFQYENASLDPERSLSLDTGLRVRHRSVEASVFFWHSFIRDLIGRAPRELGACPGGAAENPTGCEASRTRFQLVNLDGWALLRGFDASARVFMPAGFVLGATASWAWGQGPNPIPPPASGNLDSYEEQLPLSRIPPLNGAVELTWYADFGLWLGSAVRWAGAQTRLALADEADSRIPTGGTPGFAVWDLRAGYRLDPLVLLSLVVENVIDSPYRYHGSSVNGATRSLNLSVEIGF